MNARIVAVDADFLHKGIRNLENLKFESGPRRLERAGVVFRPAINRVYRNLLRSRVEIGTCFSSWRYSTP